MRRLVLLTLLAATLVFACRTPLQTYVMPKPVDTSSVPVRVLADTVFSSPSGVLAKADFPSARLASFTEVGVDSSTGRLAFVGEIPPENWPINHSPWYAFQLVSPEPRDLLLRLVFPDSVGNRYLPKTALSARGPWSYLPTSAFDTVAHELHLRLRVGPAGLFVAGQELIPTDSIRRYVTSLVRQSKLLGQPATSLRWDTIGQSTAGRPIWKLDTGYRR